MISTFLVEHRWLAPTALVLLLGVGPVVGSWLVAWPKTAWVLTGVTLLPVVFLTLRPQDRELFARCEVRWEVPTLIGPESMANILLFVAPVLLASVATRRPVLVMVAGSGLSAMVETFQAVVPALGRSCDSGDWVNNTIGAVIGALLAFLSLVLAPYWSRRARSSSIKTHK